MSIRKLLLKLVKALEDDLRNNKESVHALMLELSQIQKTAGFQISDENMQRLVDNGYKRSEEILDLLLDQIRTINLYASISEYLASYNENMVVTKKEMEVLSASLNFFQQKELYEYCQLIQTYFDKKI